MFEWADAAADQGQAVQRGMAEVESLIFRWQTACFDRFVCSVQCPDGPDESMHALNSHTHQSLIVSVLMKIVVMPPWMCLLSAEDVCMNA